MNNSWAMNGANYSADDRTIDLGVRDADPTATDQTPLVIVFSAGNSGSGAGTVTKNPKNAILVGNSLNARPGEMTANDDIRGTRDGVVARSCKRWPDAADRRRTGNRHHLHLQPSGIPQRALHRHGWHSAPGARADVGDVDGVAARRGLRRAADRLVASDAQRQDAEPRARQGVAGLEHRAGRGGHGRRRRGDRRRSEQQRGLGSRLDRERAAAGARRRPWAEDLRRSAAGVHGDGTGVHDPRRRRRRGAARCASRCRGRMPRAPSARTPRSSTTSISRCVTSTRASCSGATCSPGAFSTPGGVADDLNNTEVVVIQTPTGVYEVTVVAANIAASARTDIAGTWQDFALVIDNAEVPAADPVSVVTVLDRSGSMQVFGYVDITRQTSRQFIDLMGVDDSIGVVSFGDSGDEEYPGNGRSPADRGSVDEGCRDRRGRRHRVRRLHLYGRRHPGGRRPARRSGIATRDGAAVGRIRQQGLRQGNPAKPWAVDAAAALPADLPIYSCAMGPASDQTLLAQLADDTDGRYYFMPTIDDLFEIYNYIRGQVTGDGVIVNESSTASVSQVSGWVDGCAESVLFTVAWHDTSLRYVPRDPKGAGRSRCGCARRAAAGCHDRRPSSCAMRATAM